MSGYASETMHFTAATNLTLIEFQDEDNPPTAGGPVIDNVVLSAGGGQPEVEDDCDNGGRTTLTDASGTPFPNAASCYAFATGTTVRAVLMPSGQCVGTTFTGISPGDVQVPAGATCVMAPGAIVQGNLTVRSSTLYFEGATVTNDLMGQDPVGIDMENGGNIGNNLNINALQLVPAGEPANEFCNLRVSGNTTIKSGGPLAPVDMSRSTLEANRVAGNLRVVGNNGPVTIAGASVGRDATVSTNTYSVSVVGNTVKGNLAITDNKRPATLPRDVYAITTAYNDHVKGTARCAGNAKGSSCKVSSGTGSSLATHGSKKHKASGSTRSHHRPAKKARHARK